MACAKEKRLQDGTITYRIFVNGYNPKTNKNDKNYSETWRVPEGLTPKEIKRELEREIIRYSDEVEKTYNKYTTSTPRQKETLVGYAKKWLRIKINSEKMSKTSEAKADLVIRYLEKKFGDIALKDFNNHHVQDMLEELQQKQIQKKKAVLKRNIDKQIRENYGTFYNFCEKAKISETTLLVARKRKNIEYESAQRISKSLGLSLTTCFDVVNDEEQYYKLATIKNYFSVLSSILSSAVKKQLIDYNYASNNYTELSIAKVNKVKKDWVYDYEEYIEVLEAIKTDTILDERYKLIFQLELLIGSRRGETLAIRWNDVDFKNSILTIDSQILYSVKYGVHERDCTKNGDTRDVMVSQTVMNLLSEYKKYWDENLEDKRNDTLLFINFDGEIPNPTSSNKILSKFFDRHPELKRLSQHKFRHTVISLLLAQGTPLVNVAEMVGHLDTSTTLDNYTHFIPSTNRVCADAIDRIISR